MIEVNAWRPKLGDWVTPSFGGIARLIVDLVILDASEPVEHVVCCYKILNAPFEECWAVRMLRPAMKDEIPR